MKQLLAKSTEILEAYDVMKSIQNMEEYRRFVQLYATRSRGDGRGRDTTTSGGDINMPPIMVTNPI